VSRRPDPERIYQARRDAIRNRLIDQERIPPELVELWIRAWELEAGDRGLDRLTAAFWDGAGEWILGRRHDRRSA
jgi:hypothetical protein